MCPPNSNVRSCARVRRILVACACAYGTNGSASSWMSSVGVLMPSQSQHGSRAKKMFRASLSSPLRFCASSRKMVDATAHVHEKSDCGPGMKDGKMTAGIAAGGLPLDEKHTSMVSGNEASPASVRAKKRPIVETPR